ncbi:MAG: PHP domain-containing protein, partial [Bdellovibrionales bacterium]|nr:PHP domain-containing protein [Bdellovibrionales bacterium]
PPEAREAATEEVSTPLLEEKHLRGVFHLHTTASDGRNTLEEMVAACVERGWEYVGISDHSQSAFYAGGLKAQDIKRQRAAIDGLRGKFPGVTIFHGIESDILPDGSLDYPEKVLREFDFVIASVHGQMKMDRVSMTERLCCAIENPRTTWLGHMTGRLLLGRPGYGVDFEKILRAAEKTGAGLELNSNPYRLDVDWRLLPEARRRGVPVGIFPDAHSVAGLDDVKWGVLMARKAGLGPSHVSNTKTAREMKAWLESRK